MFQGRSIGSLQGEFSTPEEKTYPRIAIRGYSGDAIVVVSCVTSEKPYKVIESYYRVVQIVLT